MDRPHHLKLVSVTSRTQFALLEQTVLETVGLQPTAQRLLLLLGHIPSYLPMAYGSATRFNLTTERRVSRA
jgi:hypothetical protein